jgi:selenocysteine lyase/cysteine desulfurase
VSSWADRFASFDGVAWLDAAGRGPLPLSSSRALRDGLAFGERPQRLAAGYEAAHAAEARAFAARLFSCREESVSVLRGVGPAIALFVEALDLLDGDEVLVPHGDAPARADLWRAVERRGARLVEVPPDDPSGAASTERLVEAIGARTRLVAFSHVNPLHGARLDPVQVTASARRVGARVVVEATHAAGALPFELGACGVDLYAVRGEKTLLAPAGACLGIWSSGALALLGGAAPFAGSDALRGAAGALPGLEVPGLATLLALIESLRLLAEVTPARVQAHARALCDRVLAGLPPGFVPACPTAPARRSHIISFSAWDPRATAAAHARLAAARVHAGLVGNRIRVSPHLYNTEVDADRLLAALAID